MPSSKVPWRLKSDEEIGYKVSDKDVNAILKKRFGSKEKKPTKFTWKGLANFAHLFDTNIFSPHRTRRIKDLMEGNDKAEEKDYIDFFEDIEKGVYSGSQKMGYAIGDLATSGIDMGAKVIGKETELTKELTDLYEKYKIEEPELLIGKATDLLVQYGVPSTGVVKVVSRLKKFSGVQKLSAGTGAAATYLMGAKWGLKTSNIARKSGTMATVFGLTDFLATEPDRGNIVMKKEDTEGLTGSDFAAARFRNRLRFAAEGATIGGFFPLLGKPAAFGAKWGLFKPGAAVAGVGLKAVGKGVDLGAWLLSKDPVVIPSITKAIRNSTAWTGEKIFNPIVQLGIKDKAKQLPDFEKWRMFSVNADDPLKQRLKKFDNVLSWFRSIGKNTGQQFTLTSRAAREIKAKSRTIEKYMESLEKRSYDLAKSFKNQYNTKTTSPASQDHYLDQVLTYLKGDLRLDQLPSVLQSTAKNLKGELTKVKKTFGDMLPEGDLKKFILNNVNTYMRKSFAVFTNPSFQPEKEVFDGGVKYMTNLIKKNRDLRRAALEEPSHAKFTPDARVKKYAEVLVKKMLNNAKTNGSDPLDILQQISKKQLRLKDMVRTGEELPTAIKKLLGEENNLKASVLTTSSHAITQTINKKLADRIAALGVKEGWLFKDEARATARGILDAEKVHHLPGLGFLGSRLDKLYASKQIAGALRGTPGKLDDLIQNGAYRALLQFKVATQFGKTVLSPATQVRNVTSASLFPLANGHIGGRASVSEAFKMTMDDIFGAGKVLDEQKLITNIEDKIRRGVIDENIVASELGAVLKDIKKGSINTLDGLYNKLTNGKFMKTATRVYAGGDNLWKWFGDEYVQSQLKSTYKNLGALKKWFPEIQGQNFIARDLMSNKLKTYDDAIREAASWYIRNTYPTYSKVPEAIKAIRKLPFGNFVSFPAEMMRTSFNIMDIGMKEIASSNAALRQIGYRRMLGAYTVLGGAGSAALNIASELTGTSLEELEAYKSFAADWNKNSILLPLDKWVKGKGKAINFSYFSPYDVVQRPFEAMFATWGEGRLSNDKRMDIFLSSMGATLGEMFNSFVSEPIGYERIIDVLPRGNFGREGQKKAGGFVYSRTDSPGDIWMKSLVHVLEGVEPGVSTTGRKIASGLEGELKTGGQAYSLRDEVLALMSGIRIIDVDVPNNLDYKITGYQVDKRAVTKAEKFYSLKNATDRGPDTLAAEYNQINEEAFKVQQDFHYLLQDAFKMGLSRQDVIRILRKRKLGKREIGALLRGKFIPFRYSADLMNKRYLKAKKANPNAIKSFFFPRSELNKVYRSWRGKSLKYKEDEGGSILDTIKDAIISPAGAAEPIIDTSNMQTSRIETPPLPKTPEPIRQTGGLASIKNPMTGLTRTESALLSPSEQIIAGRT